MVFFFKWRHSLFFVTAEAHSLPKGIAMTQLSWMSDNQRCLIIISSIEIIHSMDLERSLIVIVYPYNLYKAMNMKIHVLQNEYWYIYKPWYMYESTEKAHVIEFS